MNNATLPPKDLFMGYLDVKAQPIGVFIFSEPSASVLNFIDELSVVFFTFGPFLAIQLRPLQQHSL